MSPVSRISRTCASTTPRGSRYSGIPRYSIPPATGAASKMRIGAAVRATVDDAQMARGVGIDTSRISMFIFALGAFLAAMGGVIGGAFLGIYPGLDFEILPLAFAVVIIGGMGSLGGAAIGALLVGLADNFGKALFPEVSYFTLYAPMALILAVKPTGLFGRE